jgi:hypothetical protein
VAYFSPITVLERRRFCGRNEKGDREVNLRRTAARYGDGEESSTKSRPASVTLKKKTKNILIIHL